MTVPYLPLARWNSQWDLNETRVRCKICRMEQDQAYATRPFVHGMNCKALRSEAQYPLRELYQILKEQIACGLA